MWLCWEGSEGPSHLSYIYPPPSGTVSTCHHVCGNSHRVMFYCTYGGKWYTIMILTNLGGFDGLRCWSLAMFGLCGLGEHRANMEPRGGMSHPDGESERTSWRRRCWCCFEGWLGPGPMTDDKDQGITGWSSQWWTWFCIKSIWIMRLRP